MNNITPGKRTAPGPPQSDDILTETMEDWEESIELLKSITEDIKSAAVSPTDVAQAQYDLVLHNMYATMDLANVGELHAANLLAIANSSGSVFSEEEKAMAADGVRMLMGFPVKE